MVATNSQPNSWGSQIEKAKEKARKLLRKVVAVDMSTAILVGKLEEVSLDNLFRANYPFVKLTFSKTRKYNNLQKLEKALDEEQVCFVNKPQMILDIDELAKKYPSIHEDTHVEIKRGRFD
ncbi:MAG: hypothetical protein V1678_02555 [Candidatus Aenigmatarchaeota archaeon]